MEPELLDDTPAASAIHNLRDMARINRYFGGYRILRSCLRAIAASPPLRILDVGAGSTLTADWLRRGLPGAQVLSSDLRADLLALGAGPRVAANALALPFRPNSVDVVVSTLFLHHLPDALVAPALHEMLRVCRTGVVVVDLLRHPLAFHFLRHTQALFAWDPLTVEDGRRSVQAAFTAAELRGLLSSARLTTARVRTHHPWFRLSVYIPKPPA
jgi:ubiquinone/menaquinone biosynthesis C-methylase UbiE